MHDNVAQAYATFLEMAAAARAALRSSHPELTPLDEADGEEFLAGLIEGAMQFLSADPNRPVFVPWMTPTRRWVDNGRDAVYLMAPVDGNHRYRISGRRGDECYLSFILYAGDPGNPQRVALNRNHVDLGVETGDTFSIDLDPPADACYVISRQYLTDPLTQVRGTFGIEVIGGRAPAVAESLDLVTRWTTATAFLRGMTVTRQRGRRPAKYVSTTPNVMGSPSGWVETDGGGRGTPDQTYASGPYLLGPDDALVMDVKFPSCAYAGVALWNRFSQTVDRRFHRSTLNHTEVSSNHGKTRIIAAHRDPGVPNWLDTGGRPRGTVFWRFLLAKEQPPPIVCRVVSLADVPSGGHD